MEPQKAAPGEHGWGSRVAAGSESAAELVYHLAGALGTELQELARRFGPDAATGLVPLVVRALELLEKAAVGPAPDSLQVSAQQAEQELRRLREENEHLRRELRCGPQEERALLRQLKEVTDRQRDELRAHSRDLLQRSQETEAADVAQQPKRPLEVGQCSFSREELEQILQERNELKANVFLLKEELAYFQRELLSDQRVPELLLEAMKVAVRKQRKKIKAKMLGTPEEAESSDDDDGSWLLLPSNKGDQPPPPESRIQTLACGIVVKKRPLELGPASNGEKRKPHSNLTWSLWPALQPPAPDQLCSALDEELCFGDLSYPRGLTLGSGCGWMCDLK
ncbi:rab-interacting lysosomal protein isoform X4 [Elephas maximus indicus]|uniref:rab-interacting lysosomal protein isoform X4 n=1 Tax=Elephas maximus indicus TaxID=99487 RepID=UPI0021164BD3|nr:rab-interacting lysosomal protein isoform X4 [Elephas maximus indicus]